VKVFAATDSMAVGGVESELVSADGSLLSRENTGKFSDFRSLERIKPEIPEHFRRRNAKFPVIRNREFLSVNREIQAN
jgi:hypothetical protein